MERRSRSGGSIIPSAAWPFRPPLSGAGAESRRCGGGHLFPASQSGSRSRLPGGHRPLSEALRRFLRTLSVSQVCGRGEFFPTGFGFSSYTLLGSSVLRLPFILSTSLGHEIAHCWWGNGVYVDYESGNWSEGLTTYVSDYLYTEMESPPRPETTGCRPCATTPRWCRRRRIFRFRGS